jgi:hypothetical protein
MAASPDFKPAGNELVTTGAEPGEKTISQRVNLESSHDYIVEFEAASSQSAHIVAGFASGTNFAPGRSFALNLDESGGPVRVRRVLNAGTSPGDLQLKIAVDSDGRLLIRKIAVLKSHPLLLLLSWLALGLALLIAVAVVRGMLPGGVGSVITMPPSSVPWVWVLITGISATWVIRNLALPRPFVFGDELLYAVLSRFAGRETLLIGNPLTPVVPNALYFHLYRQVFRFDDNFLEAAKLLNVFFFAIALFAIYGAVRRFRSRNTALAAVAIIGLGPANIYSFCFMPECMYLCLFSLMVYCFVRYIYAKPLLSATLCGICLGAESLVKPHGLILIAPWIVAVILLKLTFYQDLSWRRTGATVLCFVVTMATTLALLNFLLTGEAVFGLGSAYGPLAAKSAFSGSAGLIAGLMGSHLAAVLSLYALPLLVAVSYCLQRRVKATEQVFGVSAMVLLTLTCLITLIFTTSKFTTLWGAGSPELLRLHGRYYFFVLPWLLASFFCAYPELDWSKRLVRNVFVFGGIVMGAVALLAILKWGASHIMPFPDFPDIFWFYTQPGKPRFLVATVIGVTLIVYLVRRPSSAFYAVSLGLLAVIGSIWTSEYVLALPPTAADVAGAVFRPLILPDAWSSGIVIVDSGSDVEAYRLMFHLLGAYDVLVQDGTTPVTESAVGDDRPWVIVAGQRKVSFSYSDSVSIGRYTLYLRPEGISALYIPGKGRAVESPAVEPVEQELKDMSALFCNVDVLGGDRQSVTGTLQTVAVGVPLHVSGWAVEPDLRHLAGRVTVVLDQKTYPANYGLERPDVADFLKNRHLRTCGFSVVIPPDSIGKGAHEVAVRVVSSNGRTYSVGKRIKFKAEPVVK